MQQKESFPLLIGCSELSNYMAPSPYGLTDKEKIKLENYIKKGSKSQDRKKLEAKRDFIPDFDLPKGAKTAIEEKVRSASIGYRVDIDTRATKKGTNMEEAGIQLLNEYRMTSYTKNEERKQKGYLKGTADIVFTRKLIKEVKGVKVYSSPKIHIIDVKGAETWATMPQLEEEVIAKGKKMGYFWQGIGYMYLWNAISFELVYYMVDTPDDLIPHYVTDISPYKVSIDTDIKYCISSTKILRDEEKIQFMIKRLEECKKYADYYYNKLINK